MSDASDADEETTFHAAAIVVPGNDPTELEAKELAPARAVLAAALATERTPLLPLAAVQPVVRADEGDVARVQRARMVARVAAISCFPYYALVVFVFFAARVAHAESVPAGVGNLLVGVALGAAIAFVGYRALAWAMEGGE